MTFEYCSDVSPADWIVRAKVPWVQLIGFGPADFRAYARLRYIPDPTGPDQDEADVDVAEDHPLDIEQTRRALEQLQHFTATPEDCYFCLWEGFSGVEFPPSVLAGPMVVIPHRRYFLLHAPLADFSEWEATIGGSGFPPAFAWPADRSWCVARDVDPHWAGIGASQAAIDTLLNDSGLDVVPADPAEAQPTYY